ncbi:MAG: hypothetical protein CR991_03015 [Proteobacteria bacterium]|nr:MAG: hypothetical protein CR991_03015 [Pseudomonadota bacterium]
MRGTLSRRWGLNALLLLLLVGLMAGLWRYSVHKEKQLAAAYLLDIPLAAIRSLEIDRGQQQDATDELRYLRFERDANAWRMLAPKFLPANAFRIRQLLTLLEEPVEATYPVATANLEQYGLADGKVRLRINGEDLWLGSLNPVSGARYILQGDQVKLLKESVYAGLTGSWLQWVNTKPVPPEERLLGVEGTALAATDPSLLSAWQQADAVYLKPLADTVSVENLPAITLKLNDKKERTFYILDCQNELCLVWQESGLIYVFPESQSRLLLPEKP